MKIKKKFVKNLFYSYYELSWIIKLQISNILTIYTSE